MIINTGLPLAGGVRFSSGSYVGDGTHGADNPCSVDVGFEPKLFFVFRDDPGSENKYDFFPTDFSGCGLWVGGRDALRGVGSSNSYLTRPGAVSGSTISWYVSYANAANYMLAGYQLNDSGTTYRWFALG